MFTGITLQLLCDVTGEAIPCSVCFHHRITIIPVKMYRKNKGKISVYSQPWSWIKLYMPATSTPTEIAPGIH